MTRRTPRTRRSKTPTQEPGEGAWRTAITLIERNKILVRGYPLDEMMGRVSFGEAICLVLTGELDGGCNPRLNRFIAATLPDSELVVLDGLKHSILIEAPERVAPAVWDFLLRHR